MELILANRWNNGSIVAFTTLSPNCRIAGGTLNAGLAFAALLEKVQGQSVQGHERAAAAQGGMAYVPLPSYQLVFTDTGLGCAAWEFLPWSIGGNTANTRIRRSIYY